MQRVIPIVLAVLAVGCGEDSVSSARTFGAGGDDGIGVLSPGLWSRADDSTDDVFCFNVSADGTHLEAGDSPCGPGLAIAIEGGEDPCWFTVATTAEVPIVDNQFSLEGQGGDTVECTFWSASEVFCEVADEEARCVLAVSADLGPQ
jgi:hypothetical protein